MACRADDPERRIRADIEAGQKEIDPEQARDCYVNAIGLIIDAYGNDIFRFCVTRMKNYHFAEEISQEVHLAVFRAMPKFRFESKVRTWVLGITKKVLKKHISRKPYRPVPEIPETGTTDTAHLIALFSRLERTLKRLSRRDRKLFEEYFLDGLSIEELQKIHRRWSREKLLKRLAEVEMRFTQALCS